MIRPAYTKGEAGDGAAAAPERLNPVRKSSEQTSRQRISKIKEF